MFMGIPELAQRAAEKFERAEHRKSRKLLAEFSEGYAGETLPNSRLAKFEVSRGEGGTPSGSDWAVKVPKAARK